MTLELKVPEPVTHHQLATETNPKALKAWLVSLPPSNVHDNARAIFDALTSLNRTRLDADDRLKLLEHYQVSIDMLEAPLESLFTSVTLPARERARAAGTLARNLQLELANGYKLVLNDRLTARFVIGSRNIPALIQRLMAVYAKLMWVCCKNYASTPEGVWQEVHHIFHYVIQQKMIDGPEGVDKPILSIGGYYKQMLLLALADPYRYQPHELDKVRELILHYGSAASFEPLTAAQSTGGFFLVRFDIDSPPQFLGQRPFDVTPGQAILLDTIEMARLLHRVEASAEQKIQNMVDKTRAFASLDLLRRVIRQWSITPKRAFQRIFVNSRVAVCGGLRTVALALNGDRPLLQPFEVIPDEFDRSIRSSSGVIDSCLVLNESPGGFAVRVAPVPPQCVYRVGDIAGVRVSDNDWLVGAVRWLQTADHGDGVEIGVQVIAPSAEPAMLRPTIVNEGASFQYALLLAEVPVLQQPTLIAAPRGTFSPMRELQLFIGDREMIVRATRLVDQTPGFELMAFQSA